MKIDVAESLLRSWLRHIKHCEFAELNWKPSPEWLPHSISANVLFEKAKSQNPEAFGRNGFQQLLRQAEVDVLGLSFNDKSLYFMDVAFHLGGLNYGDRNKTVKRIYKKLVRSALIAQCYFPNQIAKIMFVSPFTSHSLIHDLNSCLIELNALVEDDPYISFELILDKTSFANEIINPLLILGSSVADTSELFLRSWQLFSPFVDVDIGVETKKSNGLSNESEGKINENQRLLTALYLAKFGHLNMLGYGNQSNTISELANRLGCTVNSLRGFRDRFDRYVENNRVGWDTPMSDEMKLIFKDYNHLAESDLRIHLPKS